LSPLNNQSSLRVVVEDERGVDEFGASDGRSPADNNRARMLTARRAPLAIQIKEAVLQYPLGVYVRGSLKSLVMSIFGHRDQQPRAQFVEALRGLNLEIQQGERVALIGHNGSGKSTLLRTIAGVYPLASGEIRVSGRIGTLLELGVGFESEATGRENIYYLGLTMGYSRRQIAKHEAEIVEFCGLGDFIDLPVRTYSAGMSLRLAFAISTQFSPEVLLVDEVFGAGDATFAGKAVERMMRIVHNAGIFVLATHDLNLVERVCSRVIWLEAGRIVADGPTDSVMPEYRARLSG
jgi:lipopolysaccharide transport system ATP-binding protein